MKSAATYITPVTGCYLQDVITAGSSGRQKHERHKQSKGHSIHWLAAITWDRHLYVQSAYWLPA